MVNAAWRRDKHQKLVTPKCILLLIISLSLFSLIFFFFLGGSSRPSPSNNPTPNFNIFPTKPLDTPLFRTISPFDCYSSPQSHPVIANLVEGVKFRFLYALSDLGSLPDKPHKNIVRLLKNKAFRRPDISMTIQDVLERIRAEKGESTTKDDEAAVIDVGANVGMATFAAAAMGYRVMAFEPVFENLQRICDGIYFNRVVDLVSVFHAAASDRLGNITVHKVVGRLDNSAVSATGAKLTFKSNEEVALQVQSIPLDEVIPESKPVLLIKIDVQGWEYHVLKGASRLLSRKAGEAPYLIYEEDERLLQASNSSSQEIRAFLKSVGYNHCEQVGTDAHCTKKGA